MGVAGIPVLESKLHVPRRRRGVVPRARLDRRLDPEGLPALVLVSAPAGFGKTTLLTEWLAANTVATKSTAWLSLDRRDSDPAVFWSYVVAALRKVAPDVGTDALSTLQSAPTALEAVVTSLLNDLEALDNDVVLVLDDYHLVESLAVQESMLFLVEHLPQQLHLVVASRADPPWPLAGLRARGELLEVRASDLRFTSQEAAAYLNDAMGLELTTADVDALEARTEGWIAALQLAALSLRGRDDRAAFVADFAGADRFVVDYLVDEVLDRQTDDVRTFLLETSILNRLTAPLCAAVTGRSDARTTLAALERSNLFLIALDDRRQWYRYHHLFGDVLRARLADEAPERIPTLHRRAGDWFEADGDRAEAIRHAMAAKDFTKAAELVELAIPDLGQARQDATLRALLDALPRDVFTNRPVLSLGLVGARMVTGETAGVEELLDDIERWIEPDRPTTAFGPRRPADDMVVHDHATFRRLPAQAAMYRAALTLLRGDLAGTVAHGQRAARLSDAEDHFGQGAAAALIGLAHWADGDLEAAARQYAAAIASFERAAYLPDILGCSLGLADIQVAQGRLGAATRTLTAGLELGTANGPLRGTADMHLALGELHFERNELEAAAGQLHASLELGDSLALPQHAYRWRVLDARLLAARGDHAGALALLGEAERLYNTDYSPKARPVTATTARIRLGAGDLAGAEQWAGDSGLTVDDEPAYLRDYEQLTFARLLLATGCPTDVIGLLQRILAAAEAGHRDGNAIEALALLALAHHAMGDTPQALADLGEALTRAEVEGFARIFLDAGPPMNALLKAAVSHGSTADEASALLAADGPPPGPAQQGLVDELSSRELDVLRLLRSDLSGPEIAAELVVSLNTVRTHTKNIFMKLGVNSRRAAVRRADELGL
ncbi:MAG: LuxR C-terminal-related transcriptional regulator [Acidimicrobiales bacterium]